MNPGYQAYLRSPQWAAIRAGYKRSGRPWACGICYRKRGGIQLHHLTYERFDHPRHDDLLPLCAPCHQEVHAHRAEHPDLSIREATQQVRLEIIQGRRQRQNAKARRNKKRAEKRAQKWEARGGLRHLLDLPDNQTVIRIRQAPDLDTERRMKATS